MTTQEPSIDLLASFLRIQGIHVLGAGVRNAPCRRDPERRVQIVNLADCRGLHGCRLRGRRHRQGWWPWSACFRDCAQDDADPESGRVVCIGDGKGERGRGSYRELVGQRLNSEITHLGRSARGVGDRERSKLRIFQRGSLSHDLRTRLVL